MDVNKKILWLADFDLSEAPGGAQRSDQIFIDYGILKGLNILKVNASRYNENINLFDFDVLISSNLNVLSNKDKTLIDKISKHQNHIRLEHDSNAYLTQEDRVKLFSNCKKTIFLTEYHHFFFTQLYGNIFKNVVIIYDPIDTNIFYDKKLERENKILYVGHMHPEKGTNDFFEYALANPNQKFAIAGFAGKLIYKFMSENIPNIEYLGLKKYEEMPDIYNKYKNIFYNPIVREPFCRSVAESICCGMMLITNEQNKIGCIYEMRKNGLDLFRNKCHNAPSEFWNTI